MEKSQELQQAELFFGKISIKIIGLNPSQKGEIIMDFTSKIPKIELGRNINAERVAVGGKEYYIYRDNNDLYRHTPTGDVQLN